MDQQMFDRFKEACNFPGALDQVGVERGLAQYLSALGINRRIVRLERGWDLSQHPSLDRALQFFLDDFSRRGAALDALDARDARAARAARDARDALAALAALDARDARAARAALDARAARDARDARDARAARLRLAAWLVQARPWWYHDWDLSWIVCAWFGAEELRLPSVSSWCRPLLDAFLSGCWFLFWTDDTLFWVAKPAMHREAAAETDTRRRLHCEDGPAFDSDVEGLYFWRDVLVPDFVVMNPETITAEVIRNEQNAEVRRVMVERMGWERFCDEARMRLLHEDELHTRFPNIPVSELVDAGQRLVTGYRAGTERAVLLEAEGLLDFEERPLRFVRLEDPSTGRRYTIRVRHDHSRCYEAVGWTFGMTEEQYKLGSYLRQGDVMLKPLTHHAFQQQHS